MLVFFVRRLIQAAVVLLVVFTITFAMVRLAPGGPFAGERVVAAEILAAQEKAYGLDASILSQYGRALGLLLRGDLGPSYVYEGRSVNDLIGDAFPISLIIGFAGFAIALLIGLPLGVLAAVRKNTALDHLASGGAMLGFVFPVLFSDPFSH